MWAKGKKTLFALIGALFLLMEASILSGGLYEAKG